MYAIPQSFVSLTIFDFILYVLYIIQGHYSLVSHPVLRSKPDVDHMYAQDEVVKHMAKMWLQKTNVFVI
jgi:hypothetical protein